jgi:hypothetical protein
VTTSKHMIPVPLFRSKSPRRRSQSGCTTFEVGGTSLWSQAIRTLFYWMEPGKRRDETSVDSRLRRRIPNADRPLNGFPIFHTYTCVDAAERCGLTAPKITSMTLMQIHSADRSVKITRKLSLILFQ